MADAIEIEIEENKSAKSVKRVRFSDEIKRFDFHGESDDSGSLSLENENTNVAITSNEKPNDEINEDPIVNSPDSENNDLEFVLGPDNNNNNELLSYPQNVTITFPSSPTSSDIDKNEFNNLSVYNATEKTTEYETSPESPELMDLINETKSMTISPTNIAKLIPDSSAEEKDSPASCRTDSEKNEYQEQLDERKEKSGASVSRKRSLEGVLLGKQTSKLNTFLRKSNCEFSSAYSLKNAVFNAWNEVKNESSFTETHSKISSVPSVKKSNDAFNLSASSKAYEMWKKNKIKSKKTSGKFTESTLHQAHRSKSKQDIEESKMAFIAWKKRKDEILKRQITERYKKEAKERSESLITEKTKRSEAESAFIAWNTHKSVILKLEKKKRQWFLEKEKELKVKKSDEAEKVYHDWLINKVYSESTNNYQIFDDKPPWIPPGKGNNLI